MAQYCKAQAQINRLDKESDDVKRALTERVRTYRSLLLDELSKQKLSCVELAEEGKEPVYLRLKQQTTSPSIDADLIVNIFTKLDSQALASLAEKYGHDLPKMLLNILTSQIRESYTQKTDKTTLSISNTKERGFQAKNNIPADVMQIASDLLRTRSELATLRQQQKNSKKPMLEEQRMVEDTVKEALKATDPKGMTTRVHMMQDGDEWVYYLRCKEKEIAPSIGIRKIVPMVENALVKTLNDSGMGREYSASFKMGAAFWTAFRANFETTMEMTRQQTKTSSRLTLDRGAPRRTRHS